MGINKVVYNGGTLIDLTGDTVTSNSLLEGYTAHDRTGEIIIGTASGGSGDGYVWQDGEGYVHLSDEEGTQISVQQLNVNASGTYTAPSGTAYSPVVVPSGTAGTPTATKGSVSNHSVSVTPSVTNSDGFISGGSKTGTAVSVSASELVSGTKSITENGTGIDVTNYASVDVAVSGGSSISVEPLSVNSNGTYTAPSGTAYSPVTVNVSGGGGYDETTIKNLIEKNDSFTSFTFPSGVTKIGAYMFAECTQLVLTSLPDTLTSIGRYAFYNCQNIELTSLPNGITSIPSYAFYRCRKLAITTLPSGVYAIDADAFQFCDNLTSISCEGRIVALGNSAFLGSSSYPMQLVSVSFPNMALTGNLGTVFGSSTAANACQQLEFVDIGSTTGIAANSFANCYKLQTLVLRKTSAVCTLANVSAFTNTPMSGYNSLTGTVYVPSNLISSYQTASNWSTLYNNGTVTFVAIEGSEYER